MKVQGQNKQNIVSKAPKKLSNEDIAAKIKAKFGDKAEIKQKKVVEDRVELSSKKGVSSSDEESFGDISNNDPSSTVTRDKLKEILKTGAFQFNDKERSALSEILK